jgi:Uma2 family endonuclease
MLKLPVTSKSYLPDEYLAMEVECDVRNEYRDGVVVPMTGGTPAHNKLISAMNALLWFALRGKPFSVFMADQRLWIPECNLYTYPDVMVIADPIQLKAGRKDTVINPLLIAEVLSESTQSYDRGDKFAAYRTLPTLVEYVLIDQFQPRVEHYLKQSTHQWLLTEYLGQESSLSLKTIAVEIALADLYEAVDLDN